jgi:hypothetical protein
MHTHQYAAAGGRCVLCILDGVLRPNSWTYLGTKVLSLKSFPPCYSQSPLLTDYTPPPPPEKWFETGL